MKLNVWDIGGQRKIRPFWKKYLENTDLLVRSGTAENSEKLDIISAFEVPENVIKFPFGESDTSLLLYNSPHSLTVFRSM